MTALVLAPALVTVLVTAEVPIDEIDGLGLAVTCVVEEGKDVGRIVVVAFTIGQVDLANKSVK